VLKYPPSDLVQFNGRLIGNEDYPFISQPEGRVLSGVHVLPPRTGGWTDRLSGFGL